MRTLTPARRYVSSDTDTQQARERKPVRVRRGRAAAVVASLAVVAALGVANKIGDDNQKADQTAILATFKDDKEHKRVVTVTAKPRENNGSYENNDSFLDRVYQTIPSDVRPVLKEYLKSEEVDDTGKYVGLIALQGYDLPAEGQGLVLQADMAELYKRQLEGQQ